jgi:hypothetical protein
MRWFEMGYDRGNVADSIINAGKVEKVCENLRRTKFLSKEFRVVCTLNAYDKWQTYDALSGETITNDIPFHLAQLEYDTDDGVRVNATVHFNQSHTMVTRSSEYIRRNAEANPDVAPAIWDETVWLLDESLAARAQQLGLVVGARMIERPNSGQLVLPQFPAIA